jgi:DNA-binding response OmpR family regulator
MHAFIIEDNYLIAQSLRDMLESLGFTSFSFARSEDAAVSGASAEKIDLLTADVRLLPGDGVRAVKTICARRAIPVIFITGYKEEILDRVPAAMVIQKPVDMDELTRAVKRALRRPGSTRNGIPAPPTS